MLSSYLSENGVRLYTDVEVITKIKKLETMAPIALNNFNMELYKTDNAYRTTADRVFSITSVTDEPLLDGILEAYQRNVQIYERIASETGLPPEVIAVFHYREKASDFLSGSFSIYIMNGEYLGNVTTLTPSGIYSESFEDVAIDWFQGKYSTYHVDNIDRLGLTYDSRDLIAMTTYTNLYNGMPSGIISSYVYNGTNLYKSGMFTADGVYNENAKDENLGTYVVLKYLLENG